MSGPLSDEQERDAFEAWARSHGLAAQFDILTWERKAFSAGIRAALAAHPAPVAPTPEQIKRHTILAGEPQAWTTHAHIHAMLTHGKAGYVSKTPDTTWCVPVFFGPARSIDDYRD